MPNSMKKLQFWTNYKITSLLRHVHTGKPSWSALFQSSSRFVTRCSCPCVSTLCLCVSNITAISSWTSWVTWPYHHGNVHVASFTDIQWHDCAILNLGVIITRLICAGTCHSRGRYVRCLLWRRHTCIMHAMTLWFKQNMQYHVIYDHVATRLIFLK